MIVTFSVANYRSFHSEETLSLVASKRLSRKHEKHEVPIPNSSESALKTAVIYGANGAGKSNFFTALRYLKSLALNPRDKHSGTNRTFFRFSDTAASHPSSFDLQFIANGRLYRFGLDVDDHRVVQEWLIQINGNSEKVIYERISNGDGKVTVKQGDTFKANDKLKALFTVGGPQNQSFLATIQANLDPDDLGDNIADVIDWFTSTLTLVAPDESFAPVGQLLAESNSFCEFAGQFLNASSTGVHHLDVVKKEISEEELYTLIPKNIISQALHDLQDHKAVIFAVSEGSELLIEPGDEQHYYSITIRASHNNNTDNFKPLDLSEESDGTRRLLNLLPLLHQWEDNRQNKVYFIDEIDRSMHPILARKFLEYFLDSCVSDKRQIIVTTHESNLLDLSLLRRDEIWFTEKDSESSTRLYSLSDFKVRNDLEIRRHYLQGRFGAIPFLGNLDQLLEDECKK
jgi:AAA15 family ATPase/GTPase